MNGCIEALTRYVQGVQALRQAVGDVNRDDLVAQIEQDHATVVAFLQTHDNIQFVLQEMLVRASFQNPRPPMVGPATDSTRSRSGNDSTSAHSSSGRDSSNRPSAGNRESSSNDGSASNAAQASNSNNETGSSNNYEASAESESSSCAESESNSSARAAPPREYSRRPTTLTVYNVPRSYTQADLIEEWPPDGSYDFLYLRYCPARKNLIRMATINFVSHELAAAFEERWNGRFLPHDRPKRGQSLAVVASALQGKDINLMLVLERAPVLPVVLHGHEWQSEEGVLELVRLAKRGIYRSVI
mmetsp:Transcript_58760/g.117549  ORF Transcript_58760/g.117549 Transcript_58760/m.117549 type:complete len:301 (+) Transcript_58760:146-1048(+)